MGCGSSSSNPPIVASKFQGEWLGTWSDPYSIQSGSLYLSVNIIGYSTGTIYNSILNQYANASGNIQYNGTAHFTYKYPGETYTADCNLVLDTSTHITGNCNTYYGGSLVGTPTIDLTKY